MSRCSLKSLAYALLFSIVKEGQQNETDNLIFAGPATNRWFGGDRLGHSG